MQIATIVCLHNGEPKIVVNGIGLTAAAAIDEATSDDDWYEGIMQASVWGDTPPSIETMHELDVMLSQDCRGPIWMERDYGLTFKVFVNNLETA